MSFPSQFRRREFLKLSFGGLGLSLPAFPARFRPRRAGRGALVHRAQLLGRHEPSRNLGHQAQCSESISRRNSIRSPPPFRAFIIGRTPAASRPAQPTKLAIIRSMHHRSSAHGKGMLLEYHGASAVLRRRLPPICRRRATDWARAWGANGREVSSARSPPASRARVQLPYPLVDNNTLAGRR